MLRRLRNLLSRRNATATPESSPPDSETAEATDQELPRVHRGPAVVHRPIPESDIDPDAVKILKRLTRFDHTAYLVGGCVRDLLLDRHPKDFDIGTTATPRQVKRLFSNSRIIGRRFRLAHIYYQNGKIIEVATFRARDAGDEAEEGPDDDILIRDDNVFGTPEEDALRRDFTINALFYDVNDGNVLDHADGLADLRRRLVRTIGDPEIRFREDPIRILRAIKFAARLDFEFEEATYTALKKTRNLIPKAASARVLEEINRFCRGGAARRSFELLRESGVFEVILPVLAEGYQEDPHAWTYLMDLLDALDRRHAAGKMASTGEILSALLLPLIFRRMGWKEDGVAQRKQGTDVRGLADQYLRPMALRLRVPRRDQEYCRQLLMTLYRMVPARNIRRATRQSLMRRPCLPDAVWILETVSQRFGGDFVSAHDEWKSSVERAPRPARRPERAPRSRPSDARRDEGGEAKSERPRRSRRRRPRGKGKEAPAKAAAAPAPKAKAKTKAKGDMPPPWDDSYFFKALPTVPEIGGEDDPGDRYGAATVARAEPASADTGAAASDTAPPTSDEDAPAPKRPRRRRRRRRKSGGSDSAPPKESSEG